MKKLIASLLAVLMMLPVLAFAEDSRQIPELDLVAGDHSGKTLEHDGYTWDAANAVLTLKDIHIGGDVILLRRTAPSTCRASAMPARSGEMTPVLPRALPSTAQRAPS